jgi:hypothetical protein
MLLLLLLLVLLPLVLLLAVLLLVLRLLLQPVYLQQQAAAVMPLVLLLAAVPLLQVTPLHRPNPRYEYLAPRPALARLQNLEQHVRLLLLLIASQVPAPSASPARSAALKPAVLLLLGPMLGWPRQQHQAQQPC